ncbi:N-acetyltransferase [Nocardioides anomalus]|uniref:N-acetyltransferase n=1 Tax=Nocardioides anomalus TaxID=2712223 RepID=A0A6G6WCX1_9ACTN|nr:N-acetyltransferase [Nocardioides anomalus]QIG42890.1 N-acetyltransferase [Nocardioides anomalus]
MIRAYCPDDAAAVRTVVSDAFGAEGARVADLAEALRATHGRAELVAEEDGDVVGHVLLSRSWIDARPALVEVLVLSPLSVAPAHQRRGTGTALVAAAIDAARALGVPAVFLEGDPAYYSARGFAPATPRGFTRPSVRIPEAAFQVVLLPAHEPWMSGALVYGEPFWSYDGVGLRDPHLASIEQAFES